MVHYSSQTQQEFVSFVGIICPLFVSWRFLSTDESMVPQGARRWTGLPELCVCHRMRVFFPGVDCWRVGNQDKVTSGVRDEAKYRMRSMEMHDMVCALAFASLRAERFRLNIQH